MWARYVCASVPANDLDEMVSQLVRFAEGHGMARQLIDAAISDGVATAGTGRRGAGA